MCDCSGDQVLIYGAGALLLAATVYLAWLGFSVTSWPQVRGTVTTLTADEIIGEDGFSWTLRKLRYTYQVSHKRYVGRRVRFGLGHWRFSLVYQGHAETLSVGQSVTVWHHPRWPRLCTLQPEGMPGAVVLVRAGVLYILMILVLNG
ncbi:MAG TPA: DUF3592 domain-containing protein [Longimicrobium sp.]|jgi:hypothetical protein|uniref:DUF3592 domain-containing protein n=1 Tax=Longimicrobium sp. TaxID=2029185 RepID=UPI002ED808DE